MQQQILVLKIVFKAKNLIYKKIKIHYETSKTSASIIRHKIHKLKNKKII